MKSQHQVGVKLSEWNLDSRLSCMMYYIDISYKVTPYRMNDQCPVKVEHRPLALCSYCHVECRHALLSSARPLKTGVSRYSKESQKNREFILSKSLVFKCCCVSNSYRLRTPLHRSWGPTQKTFSQYVHHHVLCCYLLKSRMNWCTHTLCIKVFSVLSSTVWKLMIQ